MGRKKKYCIDGLEENEAVLVNRPLVFNLVNKYGGKVNGRAYEYEDLVCAGMVGLLKAVRTYQKDKAAFSTYAYTCIRNNIFNERRRQGNLLMGDHTNWNFEPTHTKYRVSDWDILDGMTDNEKYVATEYYIYSRPAVRVQQELDITPTKFKKIQKSIEAKLVEIIQQ